MIWSKYAVLKSNIIYTTVKMIQVHRMIATFMARSKNNPLWHISTSNAWKCSLNLLAANSLVQINQLERNFKIWVTLAKSGTSSSWIILITKQSRILYSTESISRDFTENTDSPPSVSSAHKSHASNIPLIASCVRLERGMFLPHSCVVLRPRNSFVLFKAT